MRFFEGWHAGAWCAVIHGEPKSQPRARAITNGKGVRKIYTKEEQAWYDALRSSSIEGAKTQLLPKGPLVAKMHFYFKPPASKMNERMGLPHTQKPDGDNLEKMVLDAIHPASNADKKTYNNKMVLDEDARIARVERSKMWAENSGLFLTIGPWHSPLPDLNDIVGVDSFDEFCQYFFK